MKSYRGKDVDMDQLRIRNEKMPAAGNAKMNTRGDVIGKKGEIVESASDRAKAYYENNPKSVKKMSIKGDAEEDTQKVFENQILDESILEPTPDKKNQKPKKIDKAREIEHEDGSVEIDE